MIDTDTLAIENATAAPLAQVPRLTLDAFRALITTAPARGRRVSALFARGRELMVVLADDAAGMLELAATSLSSDSFPSMTPQCPEVHLFERELNEISGLAPVGHPWLKPVRFAAGNVGLTDFYRIEGEEVHEVAVGPIHAGVIEPGHFRFQCHGEDVMHLEISLGYQHRGVERALVGGPNKRSIHYAETLAGDTTIGHATAYCHTVEALANLRVPPRALALRAIALELERVANHTGDLGALAGDVGFLPTAAFCGRLRGDYLNLSAELCGSRFGRGMVRPGGVSFDVLPIRAADMLARLEAAARDTREAVKLLWESASVQARFEETGRVTSETARALGMVGPAARASGLKRDVRKTHPAGFYRFVHLPIALWASGDVFARANVRWLEIQRSLELIRTYLAALPEGEHRRDAGRLRPGAIAVALVEGWRGEICHVAITDDLGRFTTYKVVDPSFHNWIGVAMALRDQPISDFPLCNKSFNLSYCGHDL